MQIISHGEKSKPEVNQQKETIEFLKHIPPFPLDVSVAAYYLKALNAPYERYLEYLHYQDKSFSTIQENLLKEVGSYEKTRYRIITLSLEKLITADKNFVDLLLFISAIDSQNIPRDLLDIYKGKSVVDNFIYFLKKYSLIMSPVSDSDSLLSHISIHRSTQDISFSYLTEFLKLNKDSQLLKKIAYALDDYSDQAIEREDFAKMKFMAQHLEKFLHRQNLLTDFFKGLLESKLGTIYYFINDNKAKKVLEDSLNKLYRKNLELRSDEDKSRIAGSLLHIGAAYTELRLYKEAENLFEEAIHIYKNEETKDYLGLSWALSHLGNIYRRIGDYDKAKVFLEESAQLDKKYGADKKRRARTLGYLGSVYRGLGFYQKSIEALEESLEIYRQNSSNDHFRIGWTLTRLGNVYSDLGNFEKAKSYFEQGLQISKKYFPEDHMSMALTLTYLGNCYRELHDYEKSLAVLEQSLKIHEKYFDPKYRRMGWVLYHLATTYKALGKEKEAQKVYDQVLEIYANYCHDEDIETAGILRNMSRICLDKNRLEEAKDFIARSLKILESRHHVDAYRSFEVLGEIYLKKATQLVENNSQEDQSLKAQAMSLFHQALKIAEQNFPQDSLHIKRIKSEIKNM